MSWQIWLSVSLVLLLCVSSLVFQLAMRFGSVQRVIKEASRVVWPFGHHP